MKGRREREEERECKGKQERKREVGKGDREEEKGCPKSFVVTRNRERKC